MRKAIMGFISAVVMVLGMVVASSYVAVPQTVTQSDSTTLQAGRTNVHSSGHGGARRGYAKSARHGHSLSGH